MGLSQKEKALLRAGGANGVDHPDEDAVRENRAEIASELSAMIESSHSLQEVCNLLNTSLNSVLKAVDKKELYYFHSPSGPVFPAFQFTNGGPIPALQVALTALAQDAHPIAVQRLFLLQTQDLLIEGNPVSPRDWLISGRDPKAVATLFSQF